MAEQIKVFISYRNVDLSKARGERLYEILTQQAYEVFFDQAGLKRDGGVEWQQVLETNVKEAHVVLVLIEAETGKSEWVKREIDTGRANFAGIVPLVVVSKTDTVSETLQALGLDQLQYLPYTGEAHQLNAIFETIENRAYESIARRHQETEWQEAKSAQFRFKGTTCSFELLTGDATEVNHYEVLVNTENTFMQMARYFESNTLSSTIRRKGSYINEGGLLVEDTVQDEIESQICNTPHYGGTPILAGQIVVTYAGHPKSELANLDFRYVFHAATVTVDRHTRRINSIALEAIPDVVLNCLRKVATVNEQQGAVLYQADKSLEAAPANFTPLNSILFPLFGAGQGGHQERNVAEQMLEGFKRYLKQKSSKNNLQKIGLCVYKPDYAKEIAEAFLAAGFERVK